MNKVKECWEVILNNNNNNLKLPLASPSSTRIHSPPFILIKRISSPSLSLSIIPFLFQFFYSVTLGIFIAAAAAALLRQLSILLHHLSLPFLLSWLLLSLLLLLLFSFFSFLSSLPLLPAVVVAVPAIYR